MFTKTKTALANAMAPAMFVGALVTTGLSAAQEVDTTPVANEKSQIIFLEPELYQIMSDWRGEGALSYRETLVELDRLDLIESYLGSVANVEKFTLLSDYIKQFDAELTSKLASEYDQTRQNYDFETFVFSRLIEMDHPRLNSWQHSILEDNVMLFSDYAAEIDPSSFEEWFFNRDVPADSMSLEVFAEENFPELSKELLGQVRKFRPWKTGGGGSGGGTGGGASQCDCTVVASFINNPSNYTPNSSHWQDKTNNPRKVTDKWTEGFFAAHYGEAYVYGRGREHYLEESDAKQQNNSTLQFMIDCQDENTQDCVGCSADMDIYAMYGSKLQVHNDQWGLFGGASEAAAKDKVEMEIILNNGSFQAFEKGFALSQSNKSSIRMDKVQSFIGNLGAAYTKIEKNASGNVINGNDIVEYGKLADKLVKDAKAMVEVTGKKGITTETLHVEYNTNSQTSAPSHGVSQGKTYALKMDTEGALVYKGKNKHKTNNSFYGSSAGLAFALSGVQCTGNVTTPLKPTGCWSHADTYRSPHHGTTTIRDNIKQFVQFNLGTSGVDTSSHTACHSL